MADLVVAVVLLLLTAPFIAVAAVLIWIEDSGPIFTHSSALAGWGALYCFEAANHEGSQRMPRRSGLRSAISASAIGGVLRRVRLMNCRSC